MSFDPFSDPLFQFQSYLSGVDGPGFLTIDASSPVLRIDPIWADYRGAGVDAAVYGPFDRLNPDLVANYDTSHLPDYDPEPNVQTSEAAALGTLWAGIVAADDNGVGLVGVAPEAAISAVSQPWDETDILLVPPQTDRFDTDVTRFDTWATTGRDGLGGILLSTNPIGSTLYGIFGSEYYTGELATDYERNNDRHMISVKGLTHTGREAYGTLEGDMTLVGAPVFTDVASAYFYDDETPTLGLDSRDDYGVSQEGNSLGYWQLLAEFEIGQNIDAAQYWIDTNGLGANAVAAGVVALMLEANPGLGWRDVQEILAYSALLTGYAPGIDDGTHEPWRMNGAGDKNGTGLYYLGTVGFGALDVFGAVRLAETWTETKTSANETALLATRANALPEGFVWVEDGDYVEYTFAAPSDLRVEHVVLSADYEASAGLFGTVADEFEIVLISPAGTESYLTGQARVGEAASASAIDMEYGSRRFWGEHADGVWTVRFYASGNLGGNLKVNALNLTFYGDANVTDDTYLFNDDVFRTADLGFETGIDDADGENVINTAAIDHDVVLESAGGASGTAGEDTLYTLSADTEIAALISGDGNDVLIGDDTPERLWSGRGNDELRGMGGNDELTGGAGQDRLSGGAGDDVFVMRPGDGSDVIHDFEKRALPSDGDKIDISAYGLTFDEIVFESEAGGLRVRLGSESILLQDVGLPGLDESDFIFVQEGPDFAETGILTLNHTAQTVTLQRSYENPVVIAFVATENGAQPVNLRISEVSGNDLTLHLQEPNSLDGSHANETVNYLVVEAGTWILPDGTLLEAGTLTSDQLSSQGFESVTFDAEFDSAPVVLSQVQTINGGDFVTTRQRKADADGVELTMQEEEALNGGGHKTETIGWVALEAGSGTAGDVSWLAGSTAGVTHANASVGLGANMAGGAKVIAALSSYAGADSAWARGKGSTDTAFDVSVEEEASQDGETNHTKETVDYFVFNEAGTISAAPIQDIAETGTLSVNHNAQAVTLQRSYENPVVIAFVATENGAQPVNVRISEVSGNDLTLRLQEPNYLDGSHANETVNYLVVEAGTWILPDGTLLEAGTVDSNQLSSQGFESVTFDAEFDSTPVILSQVQTFNGGDFVTTRQRKADADGVELTMQEEEALNGGSHATETVGWVAMEAGSGSAGGVDWLAGRASGVTDAIATVGLGTSLPGAANVIASLSSYAGSDPGWARGKGSTSTCLDVSVEEDTSEDTETGHTAETVDYFVFNDPGVISAYDWDAFV